MIVVRYLDYFTKPIIIKGKQNPYYSAFSSYILINSRHRSNLISQGEYSVWYNLKLIIHAGFNALLKAKFPQTKATVLDN